MDFQQLFYMAMDREIPELLDPDSNGVILNLGAGKKKNIEGFPLDLPGWDAEYMQIPYPDECVKIIHAYHILEHVQEIIFLLKECQRVLIPGGIMNICVPYYKSSLHYQDLDHKHSFTEKTFSNLFNNKYYDKNGADWKFKVRFNLICGIVERNICLLTQLQKEGGNGL